MSTQFTFELKKKDQSETDKSVRCRSCDFVITDPANAVQPHEHTFRNPAGFSFHVLCYSDAPGALSVGDPTSEATWFAGYAWTFAICGQCSNHLGWWYESSDRFAGLIATRVIR
ncbi:MAG TPA: cereblon family protein [Planktothrix sp.]